MVSTSTKAGIDRCGKCKYVALEFVELTGGEDGFAARNLSENYLEVAE